MNIHRYTSSDKPIWDAFVRASKNGTFLFERDYMDYHRDRFFDHSLMFLDDKGRLVALLPANEVEIDGIRHICHAEKQNMVRFSYETRCCDSFESFFTLLTLGWCVRNQNSL